MNAPEVTLAIDGENFSGWKSISIRRGIEQISGTFELGITDRWAGQSKPWPIRPGGSCTVSIDGELVITGYVDAVFPQFDATQHGITVIGRDKTGDLVDCSAIHGSGEWRDRRLINIARDLAKPFGVEVFEDVEAGSVSKKWSIQEGETVFEALDRAARMRGVLLVVDAKGNLHITRAGSERVSTSLDQGQNVKAGTGNFRFDDRYSEYICKGQDIGSNFSTAGQNASPKPGVANDKEVRRYRPLIVIAEEFANAGKLGTRALWEAAVRLGRSIRPMITVQGWRHASGLWVPNRLVRCNLPFFNIKDDMLIVSVEYLLNEGGTVCNLELCRREAFKLIPLPE